MAQQIMASGIQNVESDLPRILSLVRAQKKLVKKNLDLIAANNVKVAGAGFGVDTNVLTLIGPEGARQLPLLSKDAAANALLDEIIARL